MFPSRDSTLAEKILILLLRTVVFVLPVIAVTIPIFGQPLGELYTVGQTFYDEQHQGSIGRLNTLDENSIIHFSWTGYIYPTQVLYNRYSSADGMVFSAGAEVSELNECKFSNIGSINARSVHCYEGTLLGQSVISVAVENQTGSTQYLEFFIPADESLFNPIAIVDSRRWIHVIAFSERSNWKYAMYYNRSDDNGLNWLNDWVFIDSLRVKTAAFAASNQGEVAAAWAHPISDEFSSILESLNNDLYLVESDDGQNWDFTSSQNITNFENGTNPDSDSLRVFDCISMVYGSPGNIHITFSCTGYWQSGGHMQTCPGAKIFHYNNQTGISYIAGDITFGRFPANDRRIFDRPSIGFNPSTNDAFCVWTQFDSLADTSSAGFLNGEVWGAYMDSQNGLWSQPVNLTETPSPGAEPGECLSENFAVIAETVDDTLHIVYFVDSEPGATGNYVIDFNYLRIPADDFIASTGVNGPTDGLNHLPTSHDMLSVYPNPFNSSTMITVNFNKLVDIELSVYNLIGQKVTSIFSGRIGLGQQNFKFTADHLPGGIYFIRLDEGNETFVEKIALIK